MPNLALSPIKSSCYPARVTLAWLILSLFIHPARGGELKRYEGGASCELNKGQNRAWIEATPDEVPPGFYSTTPSQALPGTLLFKQGGTVFRARASCFVTPIKKPKKQTPQTVIMASIHGLASIVKGTQANGFTIEGDGYRTVTDEMTAKPGYRARLGLGRSEDVLLFLQYTRWDAEQAYDREISIGTNTGNFPGTLYSVNQSVDLGGMFNVRYLPWDWIKTYFDIGLGYFHFNGDFRLAYPFALKASGSTFEFTFGTGAIIPLGVKGLFLDLNLDFSYADVSEFTVDEADLSVLVGEKLEYRVTDFQRFGVNLGLRFQF
jgi:hypothetical protein